MTFYNLVLSNVQIGHNTPFLTKSFYVLVITLFTMWMTSLSFVLILFIVYKIIVLLLKKI